MTLIDKQQLREIIEELEKILNADDKQVITLKGVESFIKVDLTKIKKSTDGKYLIGYLNGLNDLIKALNDEGVEILMPRLESVKNGVQEHIDKIIEEERKPKGYDRARATARVNLPKSMTSKEINKKLKDMRGKKR